MTMIVVTCKPACSDGNAFIGRISRAVQVIDSETQRLLGGRVAFNLDIAGAPSIGPGRLVLLDDLAPADLSGHAEPFRSDAARIRIRDIASCHSSKPRNTNCLARTRFPMPGPHERARHPWHNLGTVDLQR